MSILIKGIKMPKGCAVCPYCDRHWSKPKCHAKSAKGRYMSQKLFIDSRRQDWCPLVEVPTAEIVRCKDCKYYTGNWYCSAWNNSPGFPAVGGEMFCSMGETKGGQDD